MMQQDIGVISEVEEENAVVARTQFPYVIRDQLDDVIRKLGAVPLQQINVHHQLLVLNPGILALCDLLLEFFKKLSDIGMTAGVLIELNLKYCDTSLPGAKV